jgi:proteasome accessory factor C
MPRPEVAGRLRTLLALLPWLARRGGASLDEVAERVKLSRGKVVELLEMAACCGFPPYTPDRLIELIVYDDRVEANLDPLLARPVRLNASEGFTVAASARALLAVPGADPDGALASALAKLEKALGGPERLVVELDEPAQLAAVREAAEQRHQIEIEYYSASRDELTHRRVDPLEVFAEDGHWYMDAWCHLAGGLRHFRVDRIRRLRPTGVSFLVPSPSVTPGPDAEGPKRAFVPGPDTKVVRLLVPASCRWVAEAYPTEEVVERSGGRLEVALSVGGTAWLERLLLRLGPQAEVLSPPELADVGQRAARRLLSLYSREISN